MSVDDCNTEEWWVVESLDVARKSKETYYTFDPVEEGSESKISHQLRRLQWNQCLKGVFGFVKSKKLKWTFKE